MKNNGYIGIWLLLSFALAIIIIISFSGGFDIGSWTLKKAPVADVLLGTNDSIDIDNAQIAEVPTIGLDSVEEKIVETDTMPQSLFIFGDSMTFNLALRLAQYAEHNGHVIHSVNWDSSNTKIWAEHDTLSYYLKKFKPTQIFISLGSNEMYFKNPESRIPYVRKILEIIDTVPYVWIGPPNWKEDTGINDMLENMCGKKRFFRSEGMDFKRKADHIHPTRQSSAMWIDSVMRWLPNSSHPFIVETPPDSAKRANPGIVFLKALNK